MQPRSENGVPENRPSLAASRSATGLNEPVGHVAAPPGFPAEEALARLASKIFAASGGPVSGSPVSGDPTLGNPALGVTSLSGVALPGLPSESLALPYSEFQDLRTRARVEPAKGAIGDVPPSGSLPATAATTNVPAANEPVYYFLKECHPRAARLETGVDRARHPVPSGAASPASRRQFDVNQVRQDFPILQERVNGGKPLVWLDNGATTHKPRVVIQRIVEYYLRENSNIHRAAHELAARSTDAYESARETVARFLNAPSSKEIVFTRGATEAINLVAQAWGRHQIGEGDEILVTHLEHHANIVPWQQLAEETGALLRVAPVDDRGQVMLAAYQRLLTRKTRLVAFPQVSNALGTVTPARQMIEMAHRAGALTLVDGAQSVAHMRQDVTELDADFFVFSGHKVFAPTGIGVLYGKADLLDTMQPWQGGGNMIEDVTFEATTYQAAPARFEAGTGSIADAVGLGVALEYLETLGIENISRYEHDLLEYGTAELLKVPGLHLIGTAAEKAGVLSFVIDGLRTEDIGKGLSHEGIAVRAGHHCAQPILRRFGLESTVRASLALYNTPAEIDALVAALRRIRASGGAV